MKISFESRDQDGIELRDTALRRLRFAMRRLAPEVALARVRLFDINGPRGGIDKRCKLELQTQTAGTLVITATAGGWRAAFERALARASRVLKKAAHRARQHPRGRVQALPGEAL